jgi:hypothetical protein
MYFVGRRKIGDRRSLKETGTKRNRDEEGGGRKEETIAFWITSAETQDESLSQSGKALLQIHNFSHSYREAVL